MSDDENVSRLANPNQQQHQQQRSSKPHGNDAMKQLSAHLRRKKKRARSKGLEGRKPLNKEEAPAAPEKKRQKRPPFKYGMARKKQAPKPLSTKLLKEKLREASFVEEMREFEEFSMLMRLKLEMTKRPAR